MKVKKIKAMPYGHRITLLKVKSIDEFQGFLKENDLPVYEGEDILAATSRLWEIDKKTGLKHICTYVTFNVKNERQKITVGTIAHEVHHVICNILDAIGEVPTTETQEHIAYQIGFLVDEICDFLRHDKTVK